MVAAPHRWLPERFSVERIVATVGLVSDTHMPERWAALPSPLFEILRGVDLVLHAGDVGELWTLDQLSVVAPVVAVHGNDDSPDAQRELPYQQIVTIGGQRILLCHSHHPDREQEIASRGNDSWGPKLQRRSEQARRAGASLFVFGHTHIPMSYQQNEVLLINPGAIASPNARSRQARQTVAVLFLLRDRTPIVIHVDLAAPDRVFSPRIDWDAGFHAALSRFSVSILTPALKADWERLVTSFDATELAVIRPVVLRAAHRVWSGQQKHLKHEDILTEVQMASDLPPTIQRRLEHLLTTAAR